jgi:hypothetical protein
VIQGNPSSSGRMVEDDQGDDNERTAMGIKLDLDVNTIVSAVFKIDDATHFEMVVLDLLRPYFLRADFAKSEAVRLFALEK